MNRAGHAHRAPGAVGQLHRHLVANRDAQERQRCPLQQQRVAIARALANDPPILVADGKTVLMVTHDSDLAKRVSRAVIVADGEIVNQYVAQALSTLSVDQLAAVTRQIEPRTYTPGMPIITQGEAADRFYIITKGQVEICLCTPGGQDMVVTCLQAGQYFGEIGLLQGSPRIASVRAAGDTAVQVVTLDRAMFGGLVGDSELTRQAISRVADQRTTENVAAREREVYHA